jgi:hypothetical protein
MFDNIGQDDAARTAGESLQISALLGFAALISPDVGEDDGDRRTVDATVEAVERSFYGKRSDTLINGMPVGAESRAPAIAAPRLRAKDLIAELNLINRQIHRIMFQVDRAVTRLGTSG